MGWEKRGSKKYYYVKYRQDGQVVTLYTGAGRAAEALAAKAASKRQQQRDAEEAWVEYKKVGALLDDIQGLTQALTQATLLAAGYHTHRGQWRKKRDDKTNKEKKRPRGGAGAGIG